MCASNPVTIKKEQAALAVPDTWVDIHLDKSRTRHYKGTDIGRRMEEPSNLLTYKEDSVVDEEMTVGSYTDYQECGGGYDDGWLDTTLTFSLYSDGTQDPGCGYISTNFRGMESSGKLHYLGGNQFRWENDGYDSVSPEIYYVYAVKEGDAYQLELYNSDGEFEMTFTQYEQYIPWI